MAQADSFRTSNEAPITGADLRSSTKRRSADRRYFIGGSDARIIMGTDEAALLRLWREKRSEVGPTDLSGNLIVQLGLVTEELNRRWYEANTGNVIAEMKCYFRFRFFLKRTPDPPPFSSRNSISSGLDCSWHSSDTRGPNPASKPSQPSSGRNLRAARGPLGSPVRTCARAGLFGFSLDPNWIKPGGRRTLLSSCAPRLAKSDALAGPVLFDELDTVAFKRRADFPDRFSAPTQLALGRFQPGDRWF